MDWHAICDSLGSTIAETQKNVIDVVMGEEIAKQSIIDGGHLF